MSGRGRAPARFERTREEDGPRVSTWKRKPETKARARLRFMSEGAKDRDGRPIPCECGGRLDVWELEREMERPKTVLLCSTKGCGNGVKETARIYRAELPEAKEEEG